MRTEAVIMQELIPARIDVGSSVRKVPVIVADPGDTVLFAAGDDTISVWFPEPGVFETTEIVTMRTGDIEIPVPEGATPGTYRYVIYVHNATSFAECNSHPVMIIKKP